MSSTHYTFGTNQGLSLSNGLNSNADYSIELVFEYDVIGGANWKKIVDFKDRTSETGLYNAGTGLSFWPE